MERRILPLFKVYAVAHKLHCGIETVGFGMFKLFKNGELAFDNVRIAARYHEIRKQILTKVSLSDYREARKEIHQNIHQYDGARHQLICAKNFTLRLIFERCRSEFGTKCSFDQLKARLAGVARLDIDTGLYKALHNC
jgi:hypothetical protein